MSVRTFKCRGCHGLCTITMRAFTGDDVSPVPCLIGANMIQSELCLWTEDKGPVKEDVRITGAASDTFEKAWNKRLRKNFFGEGGKNELE